MEFITTKRGKQILVWEGFQYHKDREFDGYSSWRCVRRQKSRCPASAKYYEDRLVITHEHDHLPEFGKIEAKKSR